MKIKPLLNKVDSNNFLRQYLSACGVKDVGNYLKADLACCDSPWDYPNMRDAVKRLKRAIDLNQKIGIIVDSDHDGYTSASIIYLFIKSINPEQEVVPLFHNAKTHGIVQNGEEDKVQEVIDNKIQLLICPDSASNDSEQMHELRLHNICTLVLDHHETNKVFNYGIVVNHHIGHGLNVDLSGCGVTHKFILACAEEWNIELGDLYYDMVASSIVSDDCCVLHPENYALIKYGFTHMTNPMLITMFEKLCKGVANPHNVAWSIAPCVNAITRAGTPEEIELLFRAFVGEYDCHEAVKMCNRVRNRQKKGTDKIVEDIENSFDNNHKVIIGFSSEEYKNLSGLVANKFLGKYGKPTLILRSIGNEKYGGSLRSPIDIASKINESKFAYCQGHESAAGIFVQESELPKLIKWFDESNLDMHPCIEVAATISPDQLTMELCNTCGNNALVWGGSNSAGISEPKFYFAFETDPGDVFVCGKAHNTIKFNFKNGSGAIQFRGRGEDVENLESRHCKVEFVATLSKNEYNGNVTPQADIKEIEVTPVVKKEMDWSDLF